MGFGSGVGLAFQERWVAEYLEKMDDGDPEQGFGYKSAFH